MLNVLPSSRAGSVLQLIAFQREELDHCRSWLASDGGVSGEGALRLAHHAPWHFLNFLPLPHGHGSLRPTSFKALRTGSWWAWPQFGPWTWP